MDGSRRGEDLTGRRFGHWRVVGRTTKPFKAGDWLCICDCPNATERRIGTHALRGGKSTSCGCRRRFIDLTGKRVGLWTVLQLCDRSGQGGSRTWECQCDCGTARRLSEASLVARRGIKGCGCAALKNLIGLRFGRWTVVARGESAQSKWLCACQCGTRRMVRAYHLQHGLSDSCGCVLREARPHNFRDLTGRRFGKLVALAPAGHRGRNKNSLWRCRCDCGREKITTVSLLQRGGTQSCGCLVNRHKIVYHLFLGERLSTKEIAMLANISTTAAQLRLKKGWTEADILTPVVPGWRREQRAANHAPA